MTAVFTVLHESGLLLIPRPDGSAIQLPLFETYPDGVHAWHHALPLLQFDPDAPANPLRIFGNLTCIRIFGLIASAGPAGIRVSDLNRIFVKGSARTLSLRNLTGDRPLIERRGDRWFARYQLPAAVAGMWMPDAGRTRPEILVSTADALTDAALSARRLASLIGVGRKALNNARAASQVESFGTKADAQVESFGTKADAQVESFGTKADAQVESFGTKNYADSGPTRMRGIFLSDSGNPCSLRNGLPESVGIPTSSQSRTIWRVAGSAARVPSEWFADGAGPDGYLPHVAARLEDLGVRPGPLDACLQHPERALEFAGQGPAIRDLPHVNQAGGLLTHLITRADRADRDRMRTRLGYGPAPDESDGSDAGTDSSLHPAAVPEPRDPYIRARPAEVADESMFQGVPDGFFRGVEQEFWGAPDPDLGLPAGSMFGREFLSLCEAEGIPAWICNWYRFLREKGKKAGEMTPPAERAQGKPWTYSDTTRWQARYEGWIDAGINPYGAVAWRELQAARGSGS